MTRADDKIRKQVLEELEWDSRIDAKSLTVTARNRTVTLGGEVPTYQERAAAAEAAAAVADVENVINQISIHQLDPAQAPDSELLGRIRTTLRWNTRVSETEIHVNVAEGVVTLEGSVDTHWKRPYIEETVGNVRGVVAIHNNITVVPTRSVTDQIIAEDVMAALHRNLVVDAASIEVRVENAVVTLSGRVSSHAERKAAENDASITSGVTGVRNKLTIGEAAA